MQTPTKEQIESLIQQVSTPDGERAMVATIRQMIADTKDSEALRLSATALIRPMLEAVTLGGINPHAAKRVVFYGFYLGLLFKEQYDTPDISSEILNNFIKHLEE